MTINRLAPLRRVFFVCYLSTCTASLLAGEWLTIAPMNVTREYPGLAVLPDGKVLAVSGHPLKGKSLASAELYDPARDTWTPTGSLNVPRNGVQPPGLITLPNGKIVIVGGGSARRSVHEVELYDHQQGTWTSTGSMAAPRCVHSTTQLTSGNVLAVGGIDWVTEEVHASAEVYDYQSGKWIETDSMHTPRFNHRAVRLQDGRVLVCGGLRGYPGDDMVIADAEIYDPDTGTWNETASMHTARRSHAMVLLQDGRVLVVAGASALTNADKQLDSAEIFDPKTESWAKVGSLKEARWGPTITLLPDGKALVTGGAVAPFGSKNSAELFDPATGLWTNAGRLRQRRNGHRAITLKDGRVLIAGGHFVGRYLASCEVYVP